jgi:hypothetical protein
MAKNLGTISHTMVNWIVQIYKQGVPLDKEAPRPGRPRKMTLQDVKYAALVLARSKALNANISQRTCFPSVSVVTLRRYLHKHSLRAYCRCQVPLLVSRVRKACCGWARARLSWTQAQWDYIVFSDEVQILLL